MNTINPTGDRSNHIGADTDHAKSVPCDFPGCDGSWHEPGIEPSNWAHHADTRFDNGEVVISLIRDGHDSPTGSVWLEGTYDDLTPEGMRRLADLYETLPALLRAQADQLEAL